MLRKSNKFHTLPSYLLGAIQNQQTNYAEYSGRNFCKLLSTGLAACFEEEESVNIYIHIWEWKDFVVSITKPRFGSLGACLL
jgi:hypothetical protein